MKILNIRSVFVLLMIVLTFGCSTLNSPVVKRDNKITVSSHEPYFVSNRIEAIAIESPSIGGDDKGTVSYPEEASDVLIENEIDDKAVSPVSVSGINPLGNGNVTDDDINAERGDDVLDSALESCETAQALWNEGNPEKAIEALDEAYQLVLKLNTDKHPELIQQKEDMRFMISKRILEIYTARFTTVNGTNKEIPLTMNEYVEKEIKSFQGYERELFMEGYKRSGKYRAKIVKALKEAGLPEELSWLPFIESWYKVTALSPARALGIWQFIPSTGYRFGLKRDNWIDERMEPEKATVAAIAYLKELHRMFGDWTTVLAAYNCGEGNVLRVIRGQKINYLDNFWDLYSRLPRETARYVPRFLATLAIMKEPAKYGFNFEQPDAPLAFEKVTIAKQVQLKTLADGLGISFDELTALNPELRRQITPPVQYALKVPSGTGSTLLAKLESLPASSIPQNDYVDYLLHTVKRGDTLSRIAAKYRTNVNSIVKVNNMRNRKNLKVGQKLRIPVKSGKGSDMQSSADKDHYRARKGESLITVAKKFNTDTSLLKKINNLNSSLLYEGQILKVSY